MDAALPEAEREVVVAAEPCGHGSKFEDIYRLLAEGCFPPSFCSIKRKNLKRYARKFVVDGGEPGGSAAVSGCPGPRPAPGAACGGKPAGAGPTDTGMCRSLGLGRGCGFWAAPAPCLGTASGARSGGRGTPGWHRCSTAAPWGARWLGCSGGFHTILAAGKLRRGVRGGDSRLAASPGAAGAPRAAAAPELFPTVENDPFSGGERL
ncbi:hypothetical protein Nmel_015298 [Mimus melanotis]